MDFLIYLLPLFGALGLGYMLIQSAWVNKQDAGDGKMQDISTAIAEGAMAFLKAEYRVLTIFGTVACILLFFLSKMVPEGHTHWTIVIAFIIGAVFSAYAGYIGMKIATAANVRTTQAARTSLAKALEVSFKGGSVMGLGVAGLAVLGLSVLFIVFFHIFMGGHMAFGQAPQMAQVLEVLAGFSIGAESIALFARVGGGIYTKAADVGADLVGKLELGIPEDDPRNPATIADNVGDNVGDVAGMGADLFGSYVATVLAAMVLGNSIIGKMGATPGFGGIGPILLPIVIAGMGIVFSIVGMLFVRIKDDKGDVQMALNIGNWISIVLTGLLAYPLITWMLPAKIMMGVVGGETITVDSINVFYAVLVGLVVGTLISMITEYYTAMGKKPVQSIIDSSISGAATNIIQGLAVGMHSTAMPVLLFAAGIILSYNFAGFYGVAIAATAMMANTAMQLAIDAFGPIADNAGGIAEMAGLPAEVRDRTDVLDGVGNTTAAIGKGFAIASAALTSLAIFAAYVELAGIDGINIFKANVLAALFIGAMIPVVFSAFAMAAVGRAAMAMVEEVRRQVRDIPGLLAGTARPEYEKCVAISTDAAIKEMMMPGLITIVTPLLIGVLPFFGAEALGGYMAGVTASGVLWAIFQSNAGGAWDNAKKSFEKGAEIKGKMYYKKSEPHAATVIGDTVGDPFKDTSGPSMNILIKLSSLIGLVIAPLIAVKNHHNVEAVVAPTAVTQPVAPVAPTAPAAAMPAAPANDAAAPEVK